MTTDQLKQLRNQLVSLRKELFNELLQSVKQAAAIERGHAKSSRTFVVNKRNEVARARAKQRKALRRSDRLPACGHSQAQFIAQLMRLGG